MTANWTPTRQRINLCDKTALPPRSMLINPSASTNATATAPIAMMKLLAVPILGALPGGFSAAATAAVSLNVEAASVPAQQPLQIVQLFARPRGLAKPPPQFIQNPACTSGR